MQLLNQSKNQVVTPYLEKASGLIDRMTGLLGTASLPDDKALWITSCSSIHTFFMNYPIDVVFVDRALKVRRTFANVKPWRMTLPVLGASSVFEFSAGAIARHRIEVGDQLHVGD